MYKKIATFLFIMEVACLLLAIINVIVKDYTKAILCVVYAIFFCLKRMDIQLKK